MRVLQKCPLMECEVLLSCEMPQACASKYFNFQCAIIFSWAFHAAIQSKESEVNNTSIYYYY